LLKISSKKFIYFKFLVIFFLAFSVNNFFIFFIFFELRLIPTYFLVIKGSTPERQLAGNYLILYTFLGSLPLLFRILFLGSEKGFFFLEFFSISKKFKFLLLIRAFLIKLPIFFFHL
jgi:NADH:ubiquinone oxidoreductase subunit 4 (subunit M)